MKRNIDNAIELDRMTRIAQNINRISDNNERCLRGSTDIFGGLSIATLKVLEIAGLVCDFGDNEFYEFDLSDLGWEYLLDHCEDES